MEALNQNLERVMYTLNMSMLYQETKLALPM